MDSDLPYVILKNAPIKLFVCSFLSVLLDFSRGRIYAGHPVHAGSRPVYSTLLGSNHWALPYCLYSSSARDRGVFLPRVEEISYIARAH